MISRMVSYWVYPHLATIVSLGDIPGTYVHHCTHHFQAHPWKTSGECILKMWPACFNAAQECLAAKQSLSKVAVKPELKVLIGLNMVLPKAKVHNLVDAQREPSWAKHFSSPRCQLGGFHFVMLPPNHHWLVVSTYPSEKWWSESQWVSWDDDIPNMMGKS